MDDENGGARATAAPVDEKQNYDKAFKDALVFFKDKTLDFLGIGGVPPIVEPLRTESAKVVAETEFSDLTFRLADGRGLHLEEEVNLSERDLLRFCGYHVDLIQTYGTEFISVVLTKEHAKATSLEYGMLRFAPIVVDCSERDADATLARLKAQMDVGGPINELELLYLTLYASKTRRPKDLLRESFALAGRLQDASSLDHLYALMFMVSSKVVDAQDLNQIWEDFCMKKPKLVEFIEEKGMEKGRLQHLVQLIDVKLAKHKTREQIIDELELDSHGIDVLDRIDEYRKKVS